MLSYANTGYPYVLSLHGPVHLCLIIPWSSLYIPNITVAPKYLVQAYCGDF